MQVSETLLLLKLSLEDLQRFSAEFKPSDPDRKRQLALAVKTIEHGLLWAHEALK